MKLLIVLIVVFALFASTNAEQTQDIKKQVEKLLLGCILREKDDPTCAEQVETFRRVWRFLPNELKESIYEEISNQIWSQFPGIPKPVVDRMIRNFGNPNVPAADACKYAEEIIRNEVRRREACVGKCVEDADLTPERVIRTIMKCRTDFQCYLEEIRKTMESLGPCITRCMTGGKNEIENEKCKHSHSEAAGKVRAAGINISSSGNCSDRNRRTCTSLEQVRCNTITGILTLKRASNCAITITGGTETGHSGGQYSHWNGYKLDLSLNSCLDSYIKRSFTEIGRRGDGARQWKSSSGNIYALEGNHWDITYF
jgi:hypothetical protein